MAGIPLPWFSVGVGSDPSSYEGLDFVAIGVPVVLLSLGIIGFAITWWYFEDERFSTYAALTAGFLLVITTVILVTIEAASALIPSSLLPATLRRSSIVLSAGPGLWAAFAGSLVVLTVTTGFGSRRFDLRSWISPRSRGKLGVSLLLLTLLVVVGWLRYQPWIHSSVLNHRLDLPGQAAPWVGPTSLLALWLLVAALLLALLSRVQEAGLVAAGAGWLISFLAAIAVISSETLAQLRLGALVEDSAAVRGIAFHAAPAAWATFLAGLIVAAAGGYLVCWPSQSGGR